jgi:thioredoxin-like negative regulator of GroEL
MKQQKGDCMQRAIRSCALLTLAFLFPAHAAENLVLNPHLDYSSDSFDGPLVTGDQFQDGVVAGLPNYVIIYGERCYNSKRQARRTVDLYRKYKGRVHFVIVDLDQERSVPQEELIHRYYAGSIPHVVVLDRAGRAVYNAAGEIGSDVLSTTFDQLLATK